MMRSKTGCGTCKDMRKRCDEEFDVNGNCGRCRRVGTVCRRESFRPSRAKRPSGSGSNPAEVLGTSTSGSGPVLERRDFATPLGSPRHTHSPHDARILTHFNPSMTSLGNAHDPAQGLAGAVTPYGPPTVPVPLQMAIMSARPPHVGPSLVSPPVPTTAMFTYQPGAPMPDGVGLGGSGSAASNWRGFHAPVAQHNFASGRSVTDHPLPMIPINGNTEVQAMWQSLWDPFFINDAASGLGMEPAVKDTRAREVDPEMLREIDEESSRWWSYCFFVSLPKARRLVLAQAIRQDEPDHMQRAAITVMAFAHYAEECERSGSDSYREWDGRALRVAAFAREALESSSRRPGDNLGPILDLRTAYVQRYSNTEALDLLDLGCAYLKQAKERDQLDMQDMSILAAHLMLFSDTLQCIVDMDRRPLFPLFSCQHQAATEGLRLHSTPGHFGLSVDLVIAINGILSHAPLSRSACAQTLLRSISDCPPIPITAEGGDSASALAHIALHELWRQASLILLHTIGLGKGCMAKEVQQCVEQVRFIAPTLRMKDPAPFWPSAAACPWFIISTVAIDENDRQMCRRHLQAAGDSPAYRANRSFIEELWKRVDREGHSVDWRVMVKVGSHVLAFL